MDGLNSEILINQFKNELQRLRATLDVDVDSLSKKDLKRLATRTIQTLIATLEFPVEKTFTDLSEDHVKIIDMCVKIRMMATAIEMHVMAEKEGENENE